MVDSNTVDLSCSLRSEETNSSLHRPLVTGGKDGAHQEVAGGGGGSRSLLSDLRAAELWEMMGRLKWGGEFALRLEV